MKDAQLSSGGVGSDVSGMDDIEVGAGREEK